MEDTNNLIVNCSPHSAKSNAVKKEIETLFALGKEDHIFPSKFKKRSKFFLYPNNNRLREVKNLIKFHDVEHLEQDAIDVSVPTLVELTIAPMRNRGVHNLGIYLIHYGTLDPNRQPSREHTLSTN